MKPRHRLMTTLSAGLLATSLAACGTSGNGEGGDAPDDGLTTVTAMMYPGQGYRLPIVLAEEAGIFAKHGIKLKAVDQPNNLTGTQSMAATKADVGHMVPATVVQGWQAGDDFPLFCGGITVLQTTLIANTESDLPATSEGASWQEVLKALEGKKVGVQTPVGSALQLLFAEALSEAGVEDVTYVNLGGAPTAVQAALGNGSVDVAAITPPATQILDAAQFGKPLIYMSEGPETYQKTYGSGLIAPRAWLESEPELARAFCDAQTEALEYIADHANKEEAARILAKDSALTPEVAERVVENVYSDYSTELDEDTINSTLKTYLELGIAKPEPKPTFDSIVVVP